NGVPRWVLKSAVRRRILVDGRDQIHDWLALAGTATTPIGQVLHAWLRGELDAQCAVVANEDAVRRVACWLIDCTWITPSVDSVLRSLARGDLLRRLANSVSSTFVGRNDELAWLADAIDGPTRCAVLAAKGGMGKSALLSRLLQARKAFQDGGCFALL